MKSARERVQEYAEKLLADRVRIGGAACGDAICVNNLTWVAAPLPGLHLQLARGVCAYFSEGGDTDDEYAMFKWLRDNGHIKLWHEGEYLVQCIADYQADKRIQRSTWEKPLKHA